MSHETTDASVQEYFSQFGKVCDWDLWVLARVFMTMVPNLTHVYMLSAGERCRLENGQEYWSP